MSALVVMSVCVACLVYVLVVSGVCLVQRIISAFARFLWLELCIVFDRLNCGFRASLDFADVRLCAQAATLRMRIITIIPIAAQWVLLIIMMMLMFTI